GILRRGARPERRAGADAADRPTGVPGRAPGCRSGAAARAGAGPGRTRWCPVLFRGARRRTNSAAGGAIAAVGEGRQCDLSTSAVRDDCEVVNSAHYLV